MIEATVRLNHPKQRNRWVDESPINRWLINNVGTYARFRDQVDESHPWHVDVINMGILNTLLLVDGMLLRSH